MTGLIGFAGMVLLLYGAYRYNVWVGVAILGFVLMSVAEAMKQVKADAEKEAAMSRHPVMGPSGITKDDFR